MISITDKYFNFLIDRGFKGPYNYSYIRELHTNYVKGNIIIDIVYEGSSWVYICKTKKLIPELETGTRKIIDFDYFDRITYDLAILDPRKRIFNSVYFNNTEEKNLWYFSKILRDNPEILEGNFTKFNLINSLFRKLGLRLKSR